MPADQTQKPDARSNPYTWYDAAAMQVEFRPVTAWPGPRTPPSEHRKSQFRKGWRETMSELKAELHYLHAQDIVVELETDERSIRRDGLPREDIRTNGPGVILSFGSPMGPLRYPCDTYDFWQDNLRAIALALEALRAVDRYGVTKRGEQYTGWKALPAAGTPTMTSTAAAEFLVRHGGNGQYTTRDLLNNREMFLQAYRRAALRLHPDQGGRHEDFYTLQTAKAVLEAHHA